MIKTKLKGKHQLIHRPHSSLYIIQRAAGRKKLFYKPQDYRVFRSTLVDTLKRYNIALLAFGLNPDRIHLVLKTGSNGIGEALSELKSLYLKHSDFELRKKKPSFRDEFKILLVQENRALIEAIHHAHQQGSESYQTSMESYIQGSEHIESKWLFRKIAPSAEESLELLKSSRSPSLQSLLNAKKWPLVMGEELYCQSVLESLG